MKRKFVMLSIVLLINAGVFAQKDQIKGAQSLYDSGKSQDALGILKKIEYLIYNSTDDEKSDFYFLKGNVLKDLASKKVDVDANLSAALEAYQELIKAENEVGKFKYTLQANVALRDLKSKLINGAIDDFKAGKFKESAEKSSKAYVFDKKDTVNLFNAASSSLMAKDYDAAIKYYEELKKINYSGKGITYYAVNKKTKAEESFASPSVREASITAGLHEKPRDEFMPSKKLEINKNLAYLYLEKNDLVKAEICYNKVLEMDPNYIDGYINLSYIKMQSKKALMDQMAALGTTPKEMELYDKLKVKKDDLIKSAIPYLKKALVIDPKNQEVMKSLLGVYRSLDMTNEYNTLKASM
ncbi:tetratricopeptide repeat protein [Flavobacterium aquiphilum]|uniref:tetratricopeptide repeat protein n=1 Tax=Flavobacterium aquiphilum TaxID=3003261 RepID=UPI002481889F|nr:tetratricopeptide repeat protein [Flavobacterium aquiphilum]